MQLKTNILALMECGMLWLEIASCQTLSAVAPPMMSSFEVS